MNDLNRLLASVVKNKKGMWVVNGHSVEVLLGKGKRRQTVHLSREGKYYVLKSVVLGAAAVTKRVKRWNRLAILSWLYNAEHELVTFAFDKRDRLIGIIRHPTHCLDPEELELYITTLARDCDRFEYLLRGRDKF